MFVQRCLFLPCGGVSVEVMGLQFKSRAKRRFLHFDTFSLTGALI